MPARWNEHPSAPRRGGPMTAPDDPDGAGAEAHHRAGQRNTGSSSWPTWHRKFPGREAHALGAALAIMFATSMTPDLHSNPTRRASSMRSCRAGSLRVAARCFPVEHRPAGNRWRAAPRDPCPPGRIAHDDGFSCARRHRPSTIRRVSHYTPRGEFDAVSCVTASRLHCGHTVEKLDLRIRNKRGVRKHARPRSCPGYLRGKFRSASNVTAACFVKAVAIEAPPHTRCQCSGRPEGEA